MSQGLLASQHSVLASYLHRRRCAGCRQCLKSHAPKNLCRTDIPGIRNHEGTRPLMQREKPLCSFVLGQAHDSPLWNSSTLDDSTESGGSTAPCFEVDSISFEVQSHTHGPPPAPLFASDLP